MGDLDYDFQPEAAAPRTKRAPVATAAPVVDIAPFIADPTKLPEGKWPLSEQQKGEIRKAWPILAREMGRPNDAEESRVAQLNQRLDNLLNLGEHVYGEKADKHALEAVGRHFEWIRKKEHETGGIKEAGSALNPFSSEVQASDPDPIEGLKGPSRARALAALTLVERLKDARVGTGEGAAPISPFTIITTSLPSPKDTPETLAAKRQHFAAQIEELAQGMPSQFWRPSIKHTLRARALATGVPLAPPAATQGATSAAGVPQEAEPQEMGVGEALGRGMLHGATSLSVPVMAALAHAQSVGNERRGGYEVPLGEGMTQFVPDTEAREIPFGAANATLQGAVQNPAKLAEAREAHPVATGAGEFAGGFADPALYALGPLAEAGKLAPAAKALIGRAIQGGAAAGIGTAGETGHAPSVKAVLIGMGLGAVVGKLADKVLEGPADAKVIKAIVAKYGEEAAPGTAEVAAKREAIQGAAQATDEMRAVTAGEPRAIESLGPKLVDRRNALFKEHGVAPDSKAGKAVIAIEEAIDRGDVKAAEEGRAELRKKFGKDAAEIEKLFTAREILAQARTSAHGHGNVSQYAANVHPMATLANPTASVGAQAAAATHEAMVRGGGSLPLVAIATARRLMQKPARSAQQALAKLWYARQTGESTIMQKAAEEAIHLGVPLTTVNQIAGYEARKGLDEE